MNRTSLTTKVLALCFAFVATTIACKKEDPPSKTNQDCMSAYGYAYYSPSGACSYSAALACTSTNTHWTWGGWYGFSVQFIRNGSETSGNGKMKHNWTGAPISNFLWHMNDLDASMIMCHDYDTAYAQIDQLMQITQLEPNVPNNPSSVNMNYTTGQGTGWEQMILVGGGL